MSVILSRAISALTLTILALGCGGQGDVGEGQGGAPSSTSSSVTVSASTSAASTGSGGAGGGGDGQGGEPCENTDPGEPNDTEAAAYDFGTIDCSDKSPGQIYGVLAGPDDADWFTYNGTDGITCQVNPTSGVSVSAGIARICAYFACAGGAPTDLDSCPAGTTNDTSPSGRPGCCGTTDFTVGLNCTGTTNDESRVYLRVDDPTETSVCSAYTVTFHY